MRPPAKAATPREFAPRCSAGRELLDAAGIDEKLLAELEAHGLVKRAGRLYGQDAVDIAATVARLATYGVQARNLRTVSTAADRDVSLIEQLVGPVLKQRGPAARHEAGQNATQIATLLLRLHRDLLEAGLAEAGLTGPVLIAGESGVRWLGSAVGAAGNNRAVGDNRTGTGNTD